MVEQVNEPTTYSAPGGGAATVSPEDYQENPPNPQKCVASHIQENAKIEIRAYMEFYVAALFFFVYTLHFFTHLIHEPAHLMVARIVYIFAILVEFVIWAGAVWNIRKVYYSGPDVDPDPMYPNATKQSGSWNWNIVCQDSLGLSNMLWESGTSIAERQGRFPATWSSLYDHDKADPVPDLVLTNWNEPSEATCAPYLLYMATPFRGLATNMWYASAALRTVIAIVYMIIFFVSFQDKDPLGVAECIQKHCISRCQVKRDPKREVADKKSDRYVSTHQQKLTFKKHMQYVFLVVEGMYNFCFTVLVSLIGISVLWFYYAEADDALTFSYLTAGMCDGVAGYKASRMLGTDAQKCMEEISKQKALEDAGSYFTVYVTTLIFYVLTVIESIHFIEEHDEEFNKHKMEWDTLFRWITGVVLLIECVIFFVGIRYIRTVINSTDAFYDMLPCVNPDDDDDGDGLCLHSSVLENNYPSASALNSLSMMCVGLRFVFLMLYTGAYAWVIYMCWKRTEEEHEIDEALKDAREDAEYGSAVTSTADD